SSEIEWLLFAISPARLQLRIPPAERAGGCEKSPPQPAIRYRSCWFTAQWSSLLTLGSGPLLRPILKSDSRFHSNNKSLPLESIEMLSRSEFCREHGLTFPFLLRLPGIIADLVIVLVVLQIAKTTKELSVPFWALILFALSPVSLMVSGFHGNTDTVMVMFL